MVELTSEYAKIPEEEESNSTPILSLLTRSVSEKKELTKEERR